jgi:hypothetical protein
MILDHHLAVAQHFIDLQRQLLVAIRSISTGS